MIEIDVKWEGLEQLNALLSLFDASFSQRIIEDVGAAARILWVNAAGTKLHTSRGRYIDSMGALELDDGRAAISLFGSFANMIENGADGFDMRDTMLRTNQPGWHHGVDPESGVSFRYRRVPFRHKGPDAGFGAPRDTPAGWSPGVAMGQQYAERLGTARAKVLGKQIMAAARSQTQRGKQLGPMASPILAEVHPEGLLREHHSRDLFAGMKKYSTGQPGRGASKYMTFRTISTNPDADGGWIHPGIQPPRKLLDDVITDLDKLVASHLSRYLGGIVK